MTTYEAIERKYQKANTRLLLLDYDGTLADFTLKPSDAKPTPQLLRILKQLTSDPGNTVVIVSGRDQHTLDSWLGHLPVGLVAEHGYFVRRPVGTWHSPLSIPDDWKEATRSFMEESVVAIPGSFIEEKATSLVWHYRAAGTDSAQKTAKQLVRKLRPTVEHYSVAIVPGNRIVEVRVGGVDKGTAAKEWLDKGPWDFILAAGDDTTDEDLFKAMPKEAVTIKVGAGKTSARTSVATPQELVVLLEKL